MLDKPTKATRSCAMRIPKQVGAPDPGDRACESEFKPNLGKLGHREIPS